MKSLCLLGLTILGLPAAPLTVTIEVRANGTERRDKPAEAAIDFSALLAAGGRPGTLDPNSLRLEEVTSTGALVDGSVPFQHDSPAGRLIFMLEGTTAASARRYYRVSFDRTGGSYVPVAVAPQVTLTDNVTDEGQSSYRIAARNATYYYHKQGAGFSSMVDLGGNDWIGYHATGGSAGNFRGIPNLVHPEGYFHPGSTNCTSSIASQGPLKVTIRSVSGDGAWECLWEFYPDCAKLTVLRKARAYWFLYEGTPGGALNPATDYVGGADGTRTALSASWTGDLPSPEWLYFGDGVLNRVLFLAHHEDDAAVDSYWPMEGNMTVFGFGRDGLNKHLNLAPAHFTIGLAEDSTHAGVSTLVNSAYRDLVVTLLSTPPPPGTGTGATVVYYDNPDLTAPVLTRTDPQIDHDWSTGAPDALVAPDTFSARWTGRIRPLYSETYTFTTRSDDGVRLWVNGVNLVDNWTNHGPTENSGSIALTAGQAYDLALEYYENTGGALISLDWSSPSQPRERVPSSALSILDTDADGMADAAESAVGLDPSDGDQNGNGTPDGADDWDGDGLPNASEIANGTSPGSPGGSGGGGSGGSSRDGGGCGATGLEALVLLLLRRRR